MSDNSKIEWTDASWQVTRGCARVSPGCERCYAERFAHRFSGKGRVFEGLTVLGSHGPRWTGEVRFAPENLDQPLRWKRPRKIFVNSMSDLFHEDVTNEQIAAVFGVMAACRQHTFQVLTKRAERMARWFRWVDRQAGERHPLSVPIHWAQRALEDVGKLRDTGRAFEARWPLPNVWLGVSVEDEKRAEDRIPELLDTPAAVRWISAEPILGEVSLWAYLKGETRDRCLGTLGAPSKLPGLDWVVVGGESGPGARPMDLEWARSIISDCREAGVPVFVKQHGSTHACEHSTKGGCLPCMPEDLRVREWPLALGPVEGGR